MSSRAAKLRELADDQVSRLIEAVSGAGADVLDTPGSGRDKLGDGTLGTLIAHTADNSRPIGVFASGADQSGADHSAATARDLSGRLAAAREALAPLASLADDQLDAIPPEGSFRFCDGHRSLEEVLAGLLKHQAHQVEAIETALA